jgi:hypothetical protein
MDTTIQVKVSPEMGFHWKQNILLYGIMLAIAAAMYFLLPAAITSNRLFFLVIFLPLFFVFYSKYLNKATSYEEEPLVISDKKIAFRNETYTKDDIGFYRWKIRGVNYGSVIKLGGTVSIACSAAELDDMDKYQGNYPATKFVNLSIDKPDFETLSAFTFN